MTWQKLRRLWCNDGPQTEYDAITAGEHTPGLRRADAWILLKHIAQE